LKGFEDATRIVNAANQTNIRPLSQNFFSPLQIVPSYPGPSHGGRLPATVTTHNPESFLRESAAAALVYFPGDIDRTFWEVLNVDHAKLLRNAVLWAPMNLRP